LTEFIEPKGEKVFVGIGEMLSKPVGSAFLDLIEVAYEISGTPNYSIDECKKPLLVTDPDWESAKDRTGVGWTAAIKPGWPGKASRGKTSGESSAGGTPQFPDSTRLLEDSLHASWVPVPAPVNQGDESLTATRFLLQLATPPSKGVVSRAAFVHRNSSFH
jgi:hypothetical protein